jgi:GT2 family glycosyltransferase
MTDIGAEMESHKASEPVRPRIAVVVVTYNSASLLPDFFAALRQGLDEVDATVLVADNASADDSIEVARRSWPAAQVVAMPVNRGYAAGINAAVRHWRDWDAVLILNPDIRLRPGSARALWDGLTGDIGITVPQLIDRDGHILKSLRREPRVLRTLGEAILGGDRSGRWPSLGEVVQDTRAYRQRTVSDWASGAAWMISASCWDRVGEWDESFFLYAEETEYALRARDRGQQLALVPEAVAVHLVGPSHRDPRLWSMVVINKLRLFRRRNGRIRGAGFFFALALNEALRALAGRRVHRAGLAALLRPSRRPVEVR